jgi:hypothetical protein
MYAFHGHSELDIDHINGNKSDNRIENLRYCSKRENVSFNNRKDYNKKTSKYTGVSYYKRTNSWRASIEINKKDFYLGNFKTEYDAHLAYQNKLKNHA